MKLYLPEKIKKTSISTIVVDGNTITAPTEMAECFNNFFTSVGKNLQKKIPPTKKTFTNYLKTPNLEILSQLINNSISKGIFPDICKLAQVIPIFKNDSRLLCNNYRPILLLSNISKIFEKVIHCRLNLFLEQNNCLYPFQFGFRLTIQPIMH